MVTVAAGVGARRSQYYTQLIRGVIHNINLTNLNRFVPTPRGQNAGLGRIDPLYCLDWRVVLRYLGRLSCGKIKSSSDIICSSRK